MLATTEHKHFVKTPKGAKEISERRHNLRGKMRTMLILVDASKSIDELMDQAQKLGVPPDFLEVMMREGYVAPVGDLRAIVSAAAAPAVADDEPPTLCYALPSVAGGRDLPAIGAPEGASPAQFGATGSEPSAAASSDAAATPAAGTDDEPARFRAAKSYMNETVVKTLGFRAFMFTLKLERCATRGDLAALLSDFEKAMHKRSSTVTAQVLVERMRALLA